MAAFTGWQRATMLRLTLDLDPRVPPAMLAAADAAVFGPCRRAPRASGGLPATAEQPWTAQQRMGATPGAAATEGGAGVTVAVVAPSLLGLLGGRMSLGKGLSRLSLGISDALRRLSVRCAAPSPPVPAVAPVDH